MTKTVLYCMGRSGSTRLGNIVKALSPDGCMQEPFLGIYNKGLHRRRILHFGIIEGMNGLPRPCFKHVWHLSGGPFELNSSLNRQILTYPGWDVVFVTRKNLLKRTVSNLIADQCGIYHVRNPEDLAKRFTWEYGALNEEQVKYELGEWPREIEHMRQLLRWAPKRRIETTFEELYESENGVTKMLDVLSFMGIESTPDVVSGLMKQEPNLSSRAVYEWVPNIHKIEERFGCDETGWLFKPAIPSVSQPSHP